LHEQENYCSVSAEGIELKPTYSEKILKTLDHLDFGAGFSSLFTGALYYYVCVALGRIANMLDFQQPKVMLLST
jgi:hypothetical protein